MKHYTKLYYGIRKYYDTRINKEGVEEVLITSPRSLDGWQWKPKNKLQKIVLHIIRGVDPYSAIMDFDSVVVIEGWADICQIMEERNKLPRPPKPPMGTEWYVDEPLLKAFNAVMEYIDPDKQGLEWPDPIAWDGRPIEEQIEELAKAMEVQIIRGDEIDKAGIEVWNRLMEIVPEQNRIPLSI